VSLGLKFEDQEQKYVIGNRGIESWTWTK